MTVEVSITFEFDRDPAVPSGSPSWRFRCVCGAADWGDLRFGLYKTKREALRAAEALAQYTVGELSAPIVDGGNAQH